MCTASHDLRVLRRRVSDLRRVGDVELPEMVTFLTRAQRVSCMELCTSAVGALRLCQFM